MTAVVHIDDAIRERELSRLMQRITEAQDRETRQVLWGEFKRLHAERSAGQVQAMERGWASNAEQDS